LGRDAGVVRPRDPERVEPLHAAPADENVLQCVVERMSQVQRPGDVRRRDDDRERLAPIRPAAEEALLAPEGETGLLRFLWIVGFGQLRRHFLLFVWTYRSVVCGNRFSNSRQSLSNDGERSRQSRKSNLLVKDGWSTVSLYFAPRKCSWTHPLPFPVSSGVGGASSKRRSARSDSAAATNQVSYSTWAS